MTKYVRKPVRPIVPIEAYQYDPKDFVSVSAVTGVPSWVHGLVNDGKLTVRVSTLTLSVSIAPFVAPSLVTAIPVHPGDWLVRKPLGHVACLPDALFNELYEPAPETD